MKAKTHLLRLGISEISYITKLQEREMRNEVKYVVFLFFFFSIVHKSVVKLNVYVFLSL